MTFEEGVVVVLCKFVVDLLEIDTVEEGWKGFSGEITSKKISCKNELREQREGETRSVQVKFVLYKS